MIKNSTFKPAWWLTSCHLQTMAAKLLRRNQAITVISETIELPDGDFVDLAWTEQPEAALLKPIVYVLHGLEGSIDSHYAKGMMAAIKAKGWIGVLMHFRGCSGRPNRHGPSYHSGATWDVHYCTDFLKARFANRSLAIIGFSLGGNVLTRYLSEDPNSPFDCAAVVCAPLHLASCSDRIGKGFSKIYQKYLVDMLKNSTHEKIKLDLISHLNINELTNIKTLYDFDDKVTAPINGFESADDYYEKASGLYVLDKIQKPTLIIHALDDPFLCHEYLQQLPTEHQHINFEISETGGHVGFISGNNPFKPQYWLENRVLDFFEQQFKS